MIRELEYFTDHDMKESFGDFRDVYEHEIYMSFNNDGGAGAFYDWWAKEGIHVFSKHCLENIEELSDIYG